MSVARRGALKLCGLAICCLPTFHGAALAEGTACKYISQLPDDCVGAELWKYDSLLNCRYEGIDPFAQDVIKKVLYVSSYNTTGPNRGDGSWRLGTSTSCPQSGCQGDCLAIPGAERMGEPSSLLDDRLACRQIREGQKFWRPQRRVDGQPPSISGSGSQHVGPEVLPIAICLLLEPPPKGSKRGLKCIYSTFPSAEPGS
jgi:hypothetical protein